MREACMQRVLKQQPLFFLCAFSDTRYPTTVLRPSHASLHSNSILSPCRPHRLPQAAPPHSDIAHPGHTHCTSDRLARSRGFTRSPYSAQ